MRVGFEDQTKSKAQLVSELRRLRDRVATLEGGVPAATVERMATNSPAATLDSHSTNPFDDPDVAQQVTAMLPSLVYVFDVVQKRNVLCNAMVENLLGYTVSEIQAMGDTLRTQLIHPEDLEQLPEQMQYHARLADGEIHEWQYRARHANGCYRWFDADYMVLRRFPDGKPHLMLVVAHDITALKESEETVKRTQRRLERQNAVLRELVCNPALARGDRAAGLAAITEATSRTLDVAFVSVWLFDESRRNLVCHDAFEAGHHTHGLALDATAFPVFFAALAADRVLAIDDAEHDPRARELYHVVAAPRGVKSMLEASVRRGNELIGMLCCKHPGPARHWMVEEATFVGSMGDLVSRVLETSNTRRLEAFQVATLRVAEAASKDRALEALFRLTRATLAEATPARSVHIVVRDPDSQALQETVADPATCVDAAYTRGVQAAIERVLDRGQPLRCTTQELVAMEATGPSPSLVSGEWFGVPLMSDDGALGVLAIVWDHAPEVEGASMPRFLGEVASHLAHAVERARREQALRDRARQQAAAAELGLLALGIADAPSLFDSTVRLVARTLDVEFCKVLELLPDGNGLVLRAGVGWRPGLVGTATVDGSVDSQAGYTLLHGGPVIVRDLHRETRFSGSMLLLEHGIVSGLSTVIQTGAERRFVLGAHTAKARTFTWDDAMFLQAAANVVAVALSRLRMQTALQASEQRLKKALESVVRERDLQRGSRLRVAGRERTAAAGVRERRGQPLCLRESSRCALSQLHARGHSGPRCHHVHLPRGSAVP